jgi:hypothetical protein
MRQFIGILLYFGVYQLPRTRIVWMTGSSISLISDVMTRDRFEEIRRYLHFLDSEKAVNNPDRLCKVRLFLDPIQETMNNISPSIIYSIDEQMISYKGRTILRQYMPAKPTKWGIKVFFLCGSTGLMYKFLVYDGQNSFDTNYTAGLVLHLCEDLLPGTQVYFDNYFSSQALINTLRLKHVYVVATMRANRCKEVASQLESENSLKKKGRGSMDWRTNASNDTIFVRWFDNRAVLMVSTFCGVGESDNTVSRWDRKRKARIQVPVPDIVIAYNRHMGGVDLVDSLLSYYKICLRSKKWTTRMFYHFVDVAVTNSWLEFRRDNKQQPIMDLLKFRIYIAETLVKKDHCAKRKAGRPSLLSTHVASRQKVMCIKPLYEVRKDGVGHLPIALSSEDKGKCAYCSTKEKQVFSTIKCRKCDAFLCVKRDKNCFELYHS